MEFNKNANLVLDVCLVQIKSVDQTVDITQLTTVYHTPSKITYTGSTKNTPNGVLNDKRLTLNYPGLSSEDFDKFYDLVRGVYQVYIKTTTNDVYEVASDRFFMECSTTFNIKTGHSLVFKTQSSIPVKFRENQPADGINISGFDYDFNFYVS